jgi:hypothetical protein
MWTLLSRENLFFAKVGNFFAAIFFYRLNKRLPITRPKRVEKSFRDAVREVCNAVSLLSARTSPSAFYSRRSRLCFSTYRTICELNSCSIATISSHAHSMLLARRASGVARDASRHSEDLDTTPERRRGTPCSLDRRRMSQLLLW